MEGRLIGRTETVTPRSALGPVLTAAVAGTILLAGFALAPSGDDALANQLALFILGFPALVAGAILAKRRPALAVGVAMLLMAFAGTLSTNQDIPVKYIEGAVWVLVFGVLAGTLAGRLNAGDPARAEIWPGVAALGAYLVFTALMIPLAETPEIGLRSFMEGPAFIFAFFAFAYAPWSPEVRWRVAQAFVLVALVVGAYAAFRLLAGPTGAEESVTRKAGDVAGEMSLIGSFGSRQQLGAWTAVAIPLLFTFALAARGRWRWISGAALALMIVALLGSELRMGAIAAVIGIAVAASLYHAARAFRGEAVVALVAIVGLLGAGMIGYTLTVGEDPESRERYANILTPGDDKSFQQRLDRWEYALEGINEHPLGEGLGTTGNTQRLYSRTIRIDDKHIDNSYLQLGVQQGYPGWILFGVSVLLIGYMLVRASVATTDRRTAVLGVGASGTLAGYLVLMITGDMLIVWGALLFWMVLGLGAGGLVTRDQATPRT